MSAYPEGFFKLAAGGLEILAYHCSKCATLYTDIPQGASVFCCGKNIPVPAKVTRKVQYASARQGAVDLNQPTRIGDRILGIV